MNPLRKERDRETVRDGRFGWAMIEAFPVGRSAGWVRVLGLVARELLGFGAAFERFVDSTSRDARVQVNVFRLI